MEFWEILGISPTTDTKAIKKAYASKSKDCHPEENEAGFLALGEAYRLALAYVTKQKQQEQLNQPKEETDNHQKNNHSEGTLFQKEQPQFTALKQFVSIFATCETQPQTLKKSLLDWAMTYDFLDQFLNPVFLMQWSEEIKTICKNQQMPQPLEELLCMIYGFYYYLEEEPEKEETDKNKNETQQDETKPKENPTFTAHLCLDEDREFDGLHLIALTLENYSSKSACTKGAIKRQILPDMLMAYNYADYLKLTQILAQGLDGYRAKTALGELLTYYDCILEEEEATKGHGWEVETSRHTSAIVTLVHFIKTQNPPSAFFAVLLDHCKLQQKDAPHLEKYYEPLREIIEEKFDKVRYEQEKSRLDQLKSDFAELYLSTGNPAEKITTVAPYAEGMLLYDLYEPHDMEAFGQKHKENIDDFFKKYHHENKGASLLLHPDFIEEELLHNMFEMDEDWLEGATANLYLLNCLGDFYADYDSLIIDQFKLHLDNLLFKLYSAESYFLWDKAQPEQISLPDAFQSAYFWHYFFTNAFTHAYLDSGISLAYFLAHHYTPNIPWIYAFTQYNPLEKTQSKRTTFTLDVGREVEIHFEETLIWYSIEGERLSHAMSFQTLKEIAGESEVVFFLLMPLVIDEYSPDMERVIGESMDKMPLFYGLHRELIQFLISHMTTDIQPDKTAKIEERRTQNRLDAPLTSLTEIYEVGGSTPLQLAQKILEVIKLPPAPLAEGDASDVQEEASTDVLFCKNYRHTQMLTLLYADQLIPPFIQQFFLYTNDDSHRAEESKKLIEELDLWSGSIILGEFGIFPHHTMVFGINESGSLYFAQRSDGSGLFYSSETLASVIANALGTIYHFEKVLKIYASDLRGHRLT